jgi:gamma-glutamylcyclotransferase (GGCT)/AIG2-like uncharacterized protein YtfP
MILFVYGSLKRGARHHDELSAARFLDNARTAPRYALSSHGEYPALVQGADVVSGELYEVTPELLRRLDEFEGCPEYFRREHVSLEDGSEAMAYFAADL